MGTDLHQLMTDIGAAYLGPIEAALAGVATIAMPILDAIMILVIGLACTYAAVGGTFPIGALIQCFLSIGLAMAAINFFPTIVDATLEQINMTAGLITGDRLTSPFEVATAGAALATRAFDHAGAIVTITSGWFTGLMLTLAGGIILIAYLLISALSLVAFIEFYAAAVILGSFAGLMVVPGFQNVGTLPFSFMVSSAVRIIGISLIASYGSALISDPRFGIPSPDEEVFWLNAFIALGLSVTMLYLAWTTNNLVSGHMVSGRVGYGGGIEWAKGVVGGAVRTVAGGGAGGGAGGAGGGGSSGGGPGRRAALQGAGSEPGSTSSPVNSRRT